MTRLAFEPVELLLRGSDEIDRYRTDPDMLDNIVTTTYLARRFNVARNTVCRWRKHGISHHIADRIALMLDLHPAVIWHDYYGDIMEQTNIDIDDIDDVDLHAIDCVCDECTEGRVLALLERNGE